MIKCSGITHITLTVADIERSRNFYSKLFEIELEDGKDYFSLQDAGLSVFFTKWPKTKTDDEFDENRVGLDHVAFGVGSMEELKKAEKRLKELRAKTVGIETCQYSGLPYICFRDPDNIQVEFYMNQKK